MKDRTLRCGMSEPFGSFPTVELGNATVRLVVVPRLGARVIALIDRRSGRNWLVPGAPPGKAALSRWSSQDATFGGDEAFGWDECLPTVGACSDVVDRGGSPLRDHGDLWGRPTAVECQADRIRAVWRNSALSYVFARSLQLDGETVRVRYSLRNEGASDIPVHWALHALLAVEPGSRIELPSPARARVGTQLGVALVMDAGTVPWPVAMMIGGASIDLAEVRDAEVGTALKLAIDAPQTPIAAVTPDDSRLSFAWETGAVGAVGIWLDCGGWPADEGRHQVAIEPQTSPHESLESAFAEARSLTVPRNGRLSWEVRIRLQAPGST